MKNFLIKQYKKDNLFKIKHNYLPPQFRSIEREVALSIKKLFQKCDFTLGDAVNKFENEIKKLLNAKYVISVGSGTDALMLSLKSAGIKDGDEVITTPFTFYATIGGIVTAGAKPVFVDIKDDFNIDEKQIEKKITKKTKAILPVHWAGRICEMQHISKIAKKYNLKIIEDSCHAILAKKNNKFAGNFSDYGCFSMHPLKNLNVCGDGGFIIVNTKKNYDQLRLLRNHGLISRNINKIFAYNSRLDTLQAHIALIMLKKIKYITKKRIQNSLFIDQKLLKNKNITTVERKKNLIEVFHLYQFKVKNKKIRDNLIKFLNKKGVDAKIHYPIAMHLQPAAKRYGYKKGDFPITEKTCNTVISLPVHEFINKKDLLYMSKLIENFFK